MCSFVNGADVGARVSCKLDYDGFAGKDWAGKLKMVFVWVPYEGRIETEGESPASDRYFMQAEDGGCGGADSSHT